jgi:hypothetical protein
MTGLSSDLMRRLREALLRCGPFDSAAELRALFVDARLRPWRDRVPEAPNRQARVQALIALLVDAANVARESALVLFVDVLRDSMDPGMACYHDLDALAAELAGVLQPEVARQKPAKAVGEGGLRAEGDVHGDAVTGGKATTFDQRGQQVRQQTNVAGDYHDRGGGITYITHIEHASGIAIGNGAHSTQITGDGNAMGNNNQTDVQKGGIRARRIEAENVVNGVMLPAQALEQAEGLVALTRAIERGGIEADEIKARNVVEGLLVTELRTVDDLRQEVGALRQQVQAALEAGEVADAGDAADVAEALETAEAALAEPEPQGRRVTRKLKEAADVLAGAAEAATAAGKASQAVIKLAPVAMMLWKLAERVL